jgi:hypothetical protein
MENDIIKITVFYGYSYPSAVGSLKYPYNFSAYFMGILHETITRVTGSWKLHHENHCIFRVSLCSVDRIIKVPL